MASEKKDAVASSVANYSSAIHESASSLEQKDPNLAWFTHRAADKLQGIAEYLRTKDIRAMRDDGEKLACRHPAAFFGGLFVAGLILGNVVKASRRKTTGDDQSSSQEGERDALDSPSGGEPIELTAAERTAAGI